MDTDLARAFTLIRQLQGALGGRQIVTGGVSSTGTIGYGTGFTVTRTGVGIYPVTFTVPFRATPTLQFGSDNGTPLAPYFTAPSVSGFTAQVVDLAGAHVDAFWNFMACG